MAVVGHLLGAVRAHRGRERTAGDTVCPHSVRTSVSGGHVEAQAPEHVLFPFLSASKR